MHKAFLIFFCAWGSSLLAQPYKPILDQFNEWHFTTCYFGCLTEHYYTDGDTVVDGKSYKILDGYHYISRTFLLRGDVAGRKVYLAKIDGTNVHEYLLYDFSVQEGDSLMMRNPFSPFPEVGGYFILDSIVNRPLADGDDYRHFYFSPAPSNTVSFQPAVWVEGVGSLSLINAPGGHPDINGVGQLSCFFKNGEIFYSDLDSIENCEPVHLRVKDFGNPLDKIVMYTPPGSKTCVLSNISGVARVEVFDLSGKEITQLLNTKNSNLMTFDTSGFSNGLYLLRVSQKRGGSRTFKLVVR